MPVPRVMHTWVPGPALLHSVSVGSGKLLNLSAPSVLIFYFNNKNFCLHVCHLILRKWLLKVNVEGLV